METTGISIFVDYFKDTRKHSGTYYFTVPHYHRLVFWWLFAIRNGSADLKQEESLPCTEITLGTKIMLGIALHSSLSSSPSYLGHQGCQSTFQRWSNSPFPFLYTLFFLFISPPSPIFSNTNQQVGNWGTKSEMIYPPSGSRSDRGEKRIRCPGYLLAMRQHHHPVPNLCQAYLNSHKASCFPSNLFMVKSGFLSKLTFWFWSSEISVLTCIWQGAEIVWYTFGGQIETKNCDNPLTIKMSLLLYLVGPVGAWGD